MKKTYIKRSLFVLFLIFMYAICYGGITIQQYSLESTKVEGEKINIVVLTDLHSVIYGREQQTLINHVKEQEPDIIFLVGDMAEERIPIRGTSLLLEGIQDICPIYYTTGNHEYLVDDIQDIRDEIEKYGVKILSDEYISLTIKDTPLIIAGIEDPAKQMFETPTYNQYQTMETAFRELDDIDGYKILLAHRPEKIEHYLTYPFDLIVSGHAHGGQIRIPFLVNGLYAPHQGIFPKYAGGLYEHDEVVHIVSRGLAKDIKPRMFNPPEVVVITLEAK